MLLPMEARSVASLPEGKDWRYEPKWDGFRCIAVKDAQGIRLISKSGKPLGRYFPDMLAGLEKINAPRFILDGELVIETAEGYSFNALQLRLHPAASRVAKLAAESPATYVLFDMLEDERGQDVMGLPLAQRRKMLEDFCRAYAKGNVRLALSPQTGSLAEAQGWLMGSDSRIDGIMAKNAQDNYLPEERQMQKYKRIRSVDCVVGGFRYGTDSKLVGSLLLGLYDDSGLLNHVGFTSAIPVKEKEAVTKKLEAVQGGEGFTGNAPGGPSRWSTERSAAWVALKPKLVVEVSFDHVSEDRFRHGTKFIRWRPDKAPAQCRMEQLYQR